jgi:hypothetical protein
MVASGEELAEELATLIDQTGRIGPINYLAESRIGAFGLAITFAVSSER